MEPFRNRDCSAGYFMAQMGRPYVMCCHTTGQALRAVRRTGGALRSPGCARGIRRRAHRGLRGRGAMSLPQNARGNCVRCPRCDPRSPTEAGRGQSISIQLVKILSVFPGQCAVTNATDPYVSLRLPARRPPEGPHFDDRERAHHQGLRERVAGTEVTSGAGEIRCQPHAYPCPREVPDDQGPDAAPRGLLLASQRVRERAVRQVDQRHGYEHLARNAEARGQHAGQGEHHTPGDPSRGAIAPKESPHCASVSHSEALPRCRPRSLVAFVALRRMAPKRSHVHAL